MSEQEFKPTPLAADLSLLGPEHVRVYQETNGERGYMWNGAPILLLTTKGRISGEPRTIAIIFTRHRDSWVIIASKGGSPAHPKWYLNLSADPHVQVQVKGDVYEAVARTAEGAEREQLWAEAVKTWASYDIYQSRTERQIPVVVLEPVGRISDS
jgi:deazaflavin-dependent oxidoreductase (nitroreductase family)